MSLVRVDCHLHTVASGDAVTTLDQLAERAARERLDVVFITDHNEISAAVTAAEISLWSVMNTTSRRSRAARSASWSSVVTASPDATVCRWQSTRTRLIVVYRGASSASSSWE